MDARADAVLDRLRNPKRADARWPLARVAWRAGELRLREAEPLLLRLLATGDTMLDYCIVVALAQCGSNLSLARLDELRSDQRYPQHVRRMASEARRQLSTGAAREFLIDECFAQLPHALAELARQGPASAFATAFADHTRRAEGAAANLLDLLYFIDNQHVRPALLQALRKAPLLPPYFIQLRRIFKSAELRRDAQVFGILAHRFDTTRTRFWMPDQYAFRHQTKPTVGPDASQAFSVQTRQYLRRRVWRTLRRLGALEDKDYVPMAADVLAAFSDDDALPIKTVTRYVWQTRLMSTTHTDPYGQYWAFCQIVYRESSRYAPASGHLEFRCRDGVRPGGEAPQDVREEAFPDLWHEQPAELFRLLTISRCQPVHAFASKALRANDAYCQQLTISDLRQLLACEYEVTAALGCDLAVSRYDANNPNHDLVLAMSESVLARARTQSREWLDANRAFFFSDVDFSTKLSLSAHADTRAHARLCLQETRLENDVRMRHLMGLLAALAGLQEHEQAIAADVATTCRAVLAQQLRTVDMGLIHPLITHPLAEVQLLGVETYHVRQQAGEPVPADTLLSILSADDASVRALGLQIVRDWLDEDLKRNIPLLVALTQHRNEDVRDGVRPITKELVEQDATFAEELVVALVDALLIAGAPEGAPSHTTRVLREDLHNHVSGVSASTVIALLNARSEPAQEIGGWLLPTHVDPQSLEVPTVVHLASHDILAVREAAWSICQQDPQRLQADAASAIDLLDAKWEDSRAFARDFFTTHMQEVAWTPDTLIGVCDSMREDVQHFGCELIAREMETGQGEEYLLKLSEHPHTRVQRFAADYLQKFAAGNIDRLRQLGPYLLSVLSRVNRGRTAKDRVFDFLASESIGSPEAAAFIAEIMGRLSATTCQGDRARAIEIMVGIHDVYPDNPLALEFQQTEVR